MKNKKRWQYVLKPKTTQQRTVAVDSGHVVLQLNRNHFSL